MTLEETTEEYETGSHPALERENPLYEDQVRRWPVVTLPYIIGGHRRSSQKPRETNKISFTWNPSLHRNEQKFALQASTLRPMCIQNTIWSLKCDFFDNLHPPKRISFNSSGFCELLRWPLFCLFGLLKSSGKKKKKQLIVLIRGDSILRRFLHFSFAYSLGQCNWLVTSMQHVFHVQWPLEVFLLFTEKNVGCCLEVVRVRS